MTRDFPIAPPGKASWLFLLGLAIGLPLFVLVLMLMLEGADKAGLPALLGVAIMVPVAALLLLSMRRTQVRIVDDVLEVKATFYTQRLPLASLDAAQARVVDLTRSGSFRKPGKHWPLFKTNGFNTPGFRAGHFRSKDLTRHFLLLTRRDKVLLVPERSGRFLLLSVERPQALLEALRHPPRG